MNRIILIGNGFDLAHKLPTSYRDFIDNYWQKWIDRLRSCNSNELSDKLCSLTIKDTIAMTQYGPNWSRFLSVYTFCNNLSRKELINLIKTDTENFQIKKSPLFQAIDTAIETKNWVDIENEYYILLKKITKKELHEYNDPRQLDSELNFLKDKLAVYLSDIQNNSIKKNDIWKDCIQNIISESFCIDDIAIEKQNEFLRFIESRWENTRKIGISEEVVNCAQYGYALYNMRSNLEAYHAKTPDLQKHKEKIINKREVHPYYLLPDNTLLLNFNYTRTAELYIPKGSNIKVNHIHGELGNDNNPIIFEYGDELDDDYKMISNLNDNDYLANIKSIRYLETDNYRRLLSFVDSAPYQIYIIGHSCGNSDRTLLNTLFEHKNCVSIKPYYYTKTDGGDNYIEIIQNISRDFNDMRLMRDRVVNKTYCRPFVTQDD